MNLDDYNEAVSSSPKPIATEDLKSSLGRHAAALADLNVAIRLQSGFMDAYANRGVAQLGLGNIDEAKSDFQIALGLAEHQENNNLKIYVEKRLQELNDFTRQDSEN